MKIGSGLSTVKEFFGTIYSQRCLGIDFSSSPIHVVLLAQRKIIDVKSIDIPTIVDSNNRVLYSLTDDEIDMLIVEHLKGIVSLSKITSDNVCIGIPRNLVTMRMINLPLVPQDQLYGLLTYEIGRHIPFPPEDTYYDAQIIETHDDATMKVLLVAALKSKVDRYIHIVEEARLTPSFVDISSFGTYNSLWYYSPLNDEECAALIDLKKDNYELTLLDGKRFSFSRSIPFTPEEGLVASFATELNRSYLSIGSSLSSRSMRRIIFSGNTSLIDDIKDDIEEKLQYKIELNEPGPSVFENSTSQPNLAPFATAIGLALRGLLKNPLEINLLPLSKRVIRKNYNLYVSLGLSIFIIVLFLFSFFYNFYEHWSERKRLNEEISKLQPEVNAVILLEKRNKEIEKQIEEFKQLYDEGYSLLDIIKELTTIIPETTWVHSMRLRRSKLTINGYSDSPEDLPRILDSSPYFDEVKMVQIVKDKFSIEAIVQKAALDKGDSNGKQGSDSLDMGDKSIPQLCGKSIEDTSRDKDDVEDSDLLDDGDLNDIEEERKETGKIQKENSSGTGSGKKKLSGRLSRGKK